MGADSSQPPPFSSSAAVPSVPADSSLGAQRPARSTPVRSGSFPTRPDVRARPIALLDFDQIELKAVERDSALHDPIGA